MPLLILELLPFLIFKKIDGKKREITPKWVMEFTSKLQCK
jgi:hypothetical protein